MKSFFLGLALAATASTAAADPVDDVVRDQMRVSHLPGVAVAIVTDGRVTKLGTYGNANLEWPSRVDTHTRFQIASATKLFTGILLMRLVEQHKLSLDDPISKFFPKAPESWSHIRVRQLANHTSGLAEEDGNVPTNSIDHFVAAAMKRPLAYATGSEARYGFADFTVLRAILEKVGGASISDLLRREIFAPLHLKDTGFAMAEDDGEVRTGELIPKRATIYRWAGDHYRTSDFFYGPMGYGAGGIFTSISDFAKLFAAIDQGKLLSPASLKELATPATLPGGRHSDFGIGWTVRQYRGASIIGHSGGPALSDIVRITKNRRTIIVLTNEHIFYPMLAQRIADLTLPLPPPPSVVDERPAVASNFLAMWNALASGQPTLPFTVSQGDPAAPLRDGFGKALVVAVGRAHAANLMSVQADGRRIYRIKFDRQVSEWVVQADAAGRIADFSPA